MESEKCLVVDSTQLTYGILQESFWEQSQTESKFDLYIYMWRISNNIKDGEVEMIAAIICWISGKQIHLMKCKISYPYL